MQEEKQLIVQGGAGLLAGLPVCVLASVGAGLARVQGPPPSLSSALDVLSHLTHSPPAASLLGLFLFLTCFILHRPLFCLPSPFVDVVQDCVFRPFSLSDLGTGLLSAITCTFLMA